MPPGCCRELTELTNQVLAFTELTDEIAITQHLSALCHSLGFSHFVYALRVPTGFQEALILQYDGYPKGWVQRYFERGHYDHDPVLAHCKDHVLPVDWNRVGDSVAVTAEGRRVMEEAAEFGLKQGLSIPVHGPRGEFGVLSLARREPLLPSDAQARLLPFLSVIAGHLHEAVRRTQNLLTEISLSPRERECLSWAAEGKSSWDISTILKLSERTVNFHLFNAMRKLEVTTRQQAVAVAVARRLITPQPF